jgi:hypothetical protein
MNLEDFLTLPTFNFDEQKQEFINHMDMLKGMSNEEYTLYKKWVEVQKYTHYSDISATIKSNIWTPTDLNDKDLTVAEINSINPEITLVGPESPSFEEWLILRIFVHTMEFEQGPGRFIRFLITDKTSGKYLGLASLASDIINLGTRDEWIGWDRHTKETLHKANHTAVATTIVPTQPFGYNFLGGKLVASMLCCKKARDAWQTTYGDELVGITTTSLYGTHSMYQRIPYWKEIGETVGRIFLKPDDKYYNVWREWLIENRHDKFMSKTRTSANGLVTAVKQKTLTMILQELQLSQAYYMHGFKRGVYYAPLYENTKDFLCNKITSDQLKLSKNLQNDMSSILDWWRPKAINRYLKLHSESRLKPDILFYNRMINTEWEDAKTQFISEVGR